MKKIMFGLGAALALVACADIESSNVVGYNTKACEKGKFYILGVQFEGTDGTMDINTLVSGFTGVDYDDDSAFKATAPQIQVPNAKGGYDIYYYLNNGYYIDADGNEAEKPGWCDLAGTIAGDEEAGAVVDGTLISGTAVWVKDVGADETFVQAGQVPADDSIEITAPVKFALRANAFPVAFNLNDTDKVSFSGLTPVPYDEASAFKQTAPQIQVPNAAGGYDIYYYLSDGYYITADGEEDVKEGWCDLAGTIAGDAEAGAIVSGDISAGQGFWTKGVGSEFKMTFKK